MATAGNREFRQSPPKSRLRNPLNVVVEKIGTTRATVHGDVSVESLKELLMSSLTLLPEKNPLDNDKQGSEKFGAQVSKIDDDGKSKKNIEDKKSGLSGADTDRKSKSKGVYNDDEEEGRDEGSKKSGARDLKIEDTKKSKNNIEDGQKLKKNTEDKKLRLFRAGTDQKPKSKRIYKDGEEEGEDDGVEASEEINESLPSCSTVFGTENSPLSNDGRWLRRNFEKPLVQGLKDVVNQKPQDPVGYLAFWLRKYRSEEEVRKRKGDLEEELRIKRLSKANQAKEQEEFTKNPEPKYDGDDEEGGGNADWNFKNYYPGFERTGSKIAAEVSSYH